MPFPALAAAIPAATLALLLLMRKKTASPVDPGPDPTPPPTPAPGPNVIPPIPWPDPLPAAPFPATVIVPITASLPNGGIRVRKGPGTNFADVAPQGSPGNDAFTGRSVTVLASGVPAQDGQGGTWWQIMPASGGPGGFARAKDSAGNQNFNVGGGGGGGGSADNGGDDGDQPEVQVAGVVSWGMTPAQRQWAAYRNSIRRRRRFVYRPGFVRMWG